LKIAVAGVPESNRLVSIEVLGITDAGLYGIVL
jgi:hypothetical protein